MYHSDAPKASNWAAFSASSVLRLPDLDRSFLKRSKFDRNHAPCGVTPEEFVKLTRLFATGTLRYYRYGLPDDHGGLEYSQSPIKG